MTAGVAVVIAVVCVTVWGVLPLLISGGPRCDSCGWTENQCSESWDYAGRACCERCKHQHRGVVDRNP